MTLLEMEGLLHDMIEAVLAYAPDNSPENYDDMLMTARHCSQEFAFHINEMDQMEDDNASH